MSSTELWRAFLESASAQVSSYVLETWLRPIRCVDYADGRIRLEVRDRFARDWLNDHYLDYIRDGLAQVLGEAPAVEWNINAELNPPLATSATETAAPEPTLEVPAVENRHLQLNARYTFSTFVSGPSNQFAVAACKAVAEHPAESYNPLFLFGCSGLGKTHLLSAIGHQILEDRPSTRIIYTSSEQFVNEVVNAVRFSKLDEFHAKYRRSCDVILMDDIQLIAGKERTQHEFFHIFNTLYDSQRQIVVTSDKLPHEIPDIEDRLRNRFQWGLIADIQPPEIETRIAILRKKGEDEGVHLTDEVTFFLADNIRSNVRELEGALIRVIAHSCLSETPITLEYARKVLADIMATRSHQLSVESIQKHVASYFQVKVADIKTGGRQKVLIRPRQVAMYLSRKHAGASYPELGARFGDKDHTTIMSACRKIESQLKIDTSLRKQITDIEKQLDVPRS